MTDEMDFLRISSSEQKPKTKIPFDIPKNDISAKYEKIRGKSLFIRFPFVLTTDEKLLEKNVRTICNRVTKIRRPRQKKAKFCLIDFTTEEDRDLSLKELKNVEINGKRLQVKIPKTDDREYVDKLVQTQTERTARLKLKKDIKRAKSMEKKFQNKSLTNVIYVGNIPHSAGIHNLRDLFPSAIDLNMKPSTSANKPGSAFVTLPTPKDAFKATKNKNFKIGENKLIVAFARLNSKGTTKAAEKSNNEKVIESKDSSENEKDEKSDTEEKITNDAVFYVSNEMSTEHEEENPPEKFPKIPKKKMNILGLSKPSKTLGNNYKRKPFGTVGISANFSAPKKPSGRNTKFNQNFNNKKMMRATKGKNKK